MKFTASITCLLGWAAAAAAAAQLPTFADGERALAGQRYSEAEAIYERLISARQAPLAESFARLGLVRFQQGKFAGAVPPLRQALALKPSLPNTGLLLAMSLSESGRFTEALPGLEKGFRQPSTDQPLRRMAGLQLMRAYTALQRDASAVEIALALSKAFPDDPEVLYHSSRLFGNFAYVNMQRLAQVAPDSVWRHQAAGEAHQSQGSYDLAITAYRSVLALDPRRPGIHFRLGRALLGRAGEGDTDQAAGAFAEELRIDPSNGNAAYELAELERRNGRHAKAEELFAAAVKLDPEFQEARVGLARTLVSQGRHAAALEHLQKAAALNPSDEVAHFQLSRVHAALGNAEEQRRALAEYQRLRTARSSRELDAQKGAFSLREVTRQQTDSAEK